MFLLPPLPLRLCLTSVSQQSSQTCPFYPTSIHPFCSPSIFPIPLILFPLAPLHSPDCFNSPPSPHMIEISKSIREETSCFHQWLGFTFYNMGFLLENGCPARGTSTTFLVFSCGHVIFWQKYLRHISVVDLLNKNLLYNFSLSLPFMLAGCQCPGQPRWQSSL